MMICVIFGVLILSGNNVLHVLPLAHEYQSPLVTDCENFMITMCKPNKGLTVSTLLDYILAGEKYDLTSFLNAAVEFCAHLDFHLLNGKQISEISSVSSGFATKQFREMVQDRYFTEVLSNRNENSICHSKEKDTKVRDECNETKTFKRRGT